MCLSVELEGSVKMKLDKWATQGMRGTVHSPVVLQSTVWHSQRVRGSRGWTFTGRQGQRGWGFRQVTPLPPPHALSSSLPTSLTITVVICQPLSEPGASSGDPANGGLSFIQWKVTTGVEAGVPGVRKVDGPASEHKGQLSDSRVDVGVK